MNKRDVSLLRDIVTDARRTLRYVAGKQQTALEADDFLLGYAVVRAIEIIGEAASKVTPETHAGLPQIRWAEIIGMRNRIIHEYSRVDYAIVWQVIKLDLPILIAELEKILPPGD
jgi:uncharacterized protein with HEPN domain